jgi:argininosuccinate lyase
MTLWGGRVGRPLDPAVSEFLRADDAELLPYDCEATAVHARRLHAAGLLDDRELEEAEQRLGEIAASAAVPSNSLLLGADEDVHSAIERLLGDVGRKIHAGRSRNDQVAAAFRLYVADACVEGRRELASFAGVVLDRAEADAETPMPGYTHLQRAQPVTVGHHLLAWVEMLERDARRFAAAGEAAADSPLGAGALAGSTLPLPAPERQLRNSLDAVADRDFALDYLYAIAVCFVHLSRIGEELVRGKAGTAIGRLTGLLVTVKGLPLAYDRDLQEDKPPVFAARRELRGALGALAVLVGGLELDRDRLAAAASDPLLLATDAAEALVRDGAPFRDAHEQVASSVREGTFAAPPQAPRPAPGPGGVRDAIAAARARLALLL